MQLEDKKVTSTRIRSLFSLSLFLDIAGIGQSYKSSSTSTNGDKPPPTSPTTSHLSERTRDVPARTPAIWRRAEVGQSADLALLHVHASVMCGNAFLRCMHGAQWNFFLVVVNCMFCSGHARSPSVMVCSLFMSALGSSAAVHGRGLLWYQSSHHITFIFFSLLFSSSSLHPRTHSLCGL